MNTGQALAIIQEHISVHRQEPNTMSAVQALEALMEHIIDATTHALPEPVTSTAPIPW